MLALLDIDGTLLIGGPQAHTAAMAAGLCDAFGVDATPEDIRAIGPAGRTDREIARLVLRAKGVPDADIDAGLAAWMAAAWERYPGEEPRFPAPVVAPGAAEALAALAGGGVELALLTGNLEPIAHAKMAQAGLGRFFARGTGAYGSDADRRDDLVPVARARHGRADEAVVIGDTPKDVLCARAGGARCVAVTTGPYDADALAGADAVVDGMPAAARVLLGWAAGSGAQSPTARAAAS